MPIHSEQVWDDVREKLASERGGAWHAGAQRAMMGMSSPEWSAYMHERIGLSESPEEINRLVVEQMLDRYWGRPALLAGGARGAPPCRRRVPARARVVVEPGADRVGAQRGWCARSFRGGRLLRGGRPWKPAPDVYLEAARRLGVVSTSCLAVEDSHSGIRAAKAAGMRRVAIPNLHFPPGAALEEADMVVPSISALDLADPATLAPLGG